MTELTRSAPVCGTEGALTRRRWRWQRHDPGMIVGALIVGLAIVAAIGAP